MLIKIFNIFKGLNNSISLDINTTINKQNKINTITKMLSGFVFILFFRMASRPFQSFCAHVIIVKQAQGEELY